MKRLISNDFLEADYGVVGEETNYIGIDGKPICVGDLVEVTVFSRELTIVQPMVKTSAGIGRKKAFIMGIEMVCNDETGEIESKVIDIKVVKSHKDLEDGEILGQEKQIRVEEI